MCDAIEPEAFFVRDATVLDVVTERLNLGLTYWEAQGLDSDNETCINAIVVALSSLLQVRAWIHDKAPADKITFWRDNEALAYRVMAMQALEGYIDRGGWQPHA
ncbi:hypothetical protein [Paraconexibacter algicola]|uniref:Uncharacterized protein n=1 Tax=Paraconexibacter algicola TaxID=2133960 RepID=A0A2T4UDI8_9ACTN|nr:hypothetical protein [Paraconexibacter algicola]PTL55568.1 hypothetical protein C7Y72_18150 [Paraconexibacter algicola]